MSHFKCDTCVHVFIYCQTKTPVWVLLAGNVTRLIQLKNLKYFIYSFFGRNTLELRKRQNLAGNAVWVWVPLAIKKSIPKKCLKNYSLKFPKLQRKVCVMRELEWVPLAINQILNSNSAQTNLSNSSQITLFCHTLVNFFKFSQFPFLFCSISAEDKISDWVPEFQKVLDETKFTVLELRIEEGEDDAQFEIAAFCNLSGS